MIEKLAEQGILGLLLAISYLVIGVLYLDNRKEKEGRMADIKYFTGVAVDMNNTLKDVVSLLKGTQK